MNETEIQVLNREELGIRVLYAFIQASAELSAVFGVGLKTFERLSHMAAFHVLRRRKLDLNGISEQLGVSRRKVDQLSRLLKDNFFERFVAPEDAKALERRIEFMLWAQPMSASRLKQVLPVETSEAVDSALESLTRAERVAGLDGVYRITTPERRLVRDDWLARVGGLTHQLSAVSLAAVGRFLKDDQRAFARTISLRVPKDKLDALETLYREEIWPLLSDLDAQCGEEPNVEAVPLTFSLCWAPVEEMKLNINEIESDA